MKEITKRGNYMKNLKQKLIAGLLVLSAFLYWQNHGLTVTEMEYNGEVPAAFNGYKILHLSDLQNQSFGKNQKTLLKKIKTISPDAIVFTGDLLDRNKTDVDKALAFMEEAVQLAPIYFVSGNHDHQSGCWDELAEGLTEIGVVVLENGKTTITKGEDEITVIGLADKLVNPYYKSVLQSFCNGLEMDTFTILLSHRPELFEYYVEMGVTLAFSGHAHGGQIRLPFVGGLFAPHQGFFPSYTSGMYIEDDTAMVVSRGLGNSVFPFRIFNRPELVVVTLEKN